VPGSVSGETYRLYRKKSGDPSYSLLYSTTSAFSYTDSSPDPRTDYSYYVLAEKNGTQSSATSAVTGYRHGEYIYSSHIGSGSSAELYNPRGLHVYGGTIYVVDNGNDRIKMYYTTGVSRGEFGSFSDPRDIVYDSNSLFITDYGTDHIEKYVWFNPTFVYSSTISSSTKIKTPLGLYFYSGSIYLADYTNNVEKYSTSGAWQATWTGTNDARDIVRASDGYFYVTDSGNMSIRKFNSTGTLVDTWDVGTNTQDYICVDDDGYLIISEYHGFDVWTTDGREIQDYSSYGIADGMFNDAEGVDFDSGYLYISDKMNNRIQIFVIN